MCQCAYAELFFVSPSRQLQDLIEERIARFANKTIVEYLGGEEEELLNAVTSHLRSHKSASELVEELEPVRHPRCWYLCLCPAS